MEPRRGLMLGRCLVFSAILLAGSAVPLPSVTASTRQSPPFTWRMADRFGAAQQADDAPDGRAPARALVVTPAREEIHSTRRAVEFDGCSAASDAGAVYNWRIDGGPPTAAGCRYTYTFQTLGRHKVEVSTTSRGQTVSAAQTIELTDYLIVSLGDSYASGEGNPDAPGRYAVAFPPCRTKEGRVQLRTPCLRQIDEEAGWTAGSCHRSSWAGPAQAALAVERDDPHSTVTFVSLACSGAEIEEGLIGPQVSRPPVRPPQLDALAELLCAPGTTCIGPESQRRVDVLILSIGGNDVGFSDIVRACARLVGSCAGEAIPEASPVAQARAKLLRFGLQYVRLYRAIDAKLNVANVLLTEYADAWIDDAGDYCVIRGLPLGATIRRDDVRWLHGNIVQPLNAVARRLAEALGWRYAGGIAQGFRGHGYCAADSWIVRYAASWARQGDDRGTLHPNREGHRFIGDRIAESLRGMLEHDRRQRWQSFP